MLHYSPDSERYDFDTNISIDDIREFFRTSRNSGPFFSIFETGIDGNIFDLIRVDPNRQYIRIFEFKSGRPDFLSDKKWQNYLPYCHTFTFVCPREAILKEDLPAGIGLMWIFKWKWKSSVFNKNWMLDSEWIKRPKKRNVDLETINRLAMMLVYRVIWRKDDVF